MYSATLKPFVAIQMALFLVCICLSFLQVAADDSSSLLESSQHTSVESFSTIIPSSSIDIMPTSVFLASESDDMESSISESIQPSDLETTYVYSTESTEGLPSESSSFPGDVITTSFVSMTIEVEPTVSTPVLGSTQTVIDFCDSEPCKNGGTCISDDSDFTCTCPPQWRNDTCETDTNECETDQDNCHDDAVCENTEGSFTCVCKPGYQGNGTHCSDTNECETDQDNCHDDAVCENTEGSFTCVCKPGYEGNGTHCSDVNECTEEDPVCHKYANCLNTMGSYTCQCKLGFSGDGKTCTRMDFCKSSPCLNGGTCYNAQAGHYECMCTVGWNGTLCEIDVNECLDPSSCDVNANCTNLNGTYSCTCKEGFHGDGNECTEIMIFMDGSNVEKIRDLGSVLTLYGPYSLGGGQPNIYVHMNGYITVGEKFSVPFPVDITTVQQFPTSLYAPFWSSIDTSSGDGYLTISQLHDGDEGLEKLSAVLPSDQLRSGLVVTWRNVSPTPAISYNNKETFTFQAVVVTDWKNSWVVFNYDLGTLTWNANSDETRKILIGTARKDLNFSVIAQYPTSGNMKSAYTIDTLEGNNGKIGRWIFKVDSEETALGRCLLWSKEQDISEINNHLSQTAPCPCTETQAKLDFNYKYDASTHSAETFFETKNRCKYDSTYGFLLTGFPNGGYPQINPPLTNQTQGRQLCCEDAPACDVFYTLFPSDDCSRYTPPNLAISWGDPHITTPRNTQYAFNGLGEFVLFRHSTFKIQCRTEYVDPPEGTTVHTATKFVGFAMKTVSSEKVELRLSSPNSISLAVNETLLHLLEDQIHSAEEFNIIKFTADRIRVIFHMGISFEVSVGVNNLQLTAMMSSNIINGDNSGLMASNVDGEFVYPNGTKLDSDSSEAELFNFGMAWQVNSTTSLFTYSLDKGQNFSDFNPSDIFIPTFYGDLSLEEKFPNNTTREEAVTLCSDNEACLIDFAATKNFSIAEATKQHQTKADTTVQQIANHRPTFTSMSETLNLTVDQTTKINFSAVDEDGDNITYIISVDSPENVIAIETDNQSYISLTPSYLVRNNSVSVRIIANDGRNGSSEYWPVLRICACSDHSECKDLENLEIPNDRLVLRSCDCEPGYEGEFCEKTYDFCERERPCYQDINCTSTAPGEFTCGSCPEGLEGEGTNCYDMNECLGEHDCEQNCHNFPGSYNCSCKKGFVLDANKKNCTDVNECDGSPCGLNEFCKNTEGSYLCHCVPGYLNHTGSCQKDLNARTYILTVRVLHTFEDELRNEESIAFTNLAVEFEKSLCPAVNISGFEDLKVLAFRNGSTIGDVSLTYNKDVTPDDIQSSIKTKIPDGCPSNCRLGGLFLTNVNDIKVQAKDFCEELSNNCDKISTNCENQNGTFACLCKPGFIKSPYFNYKCDDIDECKEDPDICTEASCENTLGSYNCKCSDGKDYVDKKCVDKCYKSPCKNGGTCLVVEESFACKCTEQWTGPTCAEERTESWKTTLIIVASVLGGVCLIALIIIIILCCRRNQSKTSRPDYSDLFDSGSLKNVDSFAMYQRRSASKSYSGVVSDSPMETVNVDYQGWSGKIPRPKRTQSSELEMVENGKRNMMEDPSKPLTTHSSGNLDGHDNPSFAGGNNPRRSGNQYS